MTTSVTDQTDDNRVTDEAAPSGVLILLIVGLGYLALAQYVMALHDPVNLGAGFWPAAALRRVLEPS